MASAPKAESMIGGGKQISASKEELKPKRKRLKTQSWSKGENGGLVASHEFEQPNGMGPYEPPEQHIFGKSEGHKAVEHFAKHMRIKGRWSPETDEAGGEGGGAKSEGTRKPITPTEPDDEGEDDAD
jgi:hypothetical protein